MPVANAKSPSLNFKRTFEEIWSRGRYDIPQFARDFLDIDLHSGQARWMNTNAWADERYLASGNRWGKSVAAAVKLLHHALYQTRYEKYASLVNRYIAVNVSITLDMANVVWDFAFTRALDSPLYRRFVRENECKRTPFPTMIIGEGGKGKDRWRSELWARSTSKRGKYLLGKDFDFVNYDEAARDPDGPVVREDVLMMRLADRNGRMDHTSTGNLRNWYYQEFVNAQKGETKHLYAQTGSSYENPHIDHNKLKRNEARLSEEYALQNIYGGFATSSRIFPVEFIENCYRDQDYHLPVEPKRGGQYVCGVDWGRLEDETVILVVRIDKNPRQLVYAQALGGHDTTWDDIYHHVAEVHHEYNRAFTLVDSTSQAGDMHLQALRNNHNVKNVEGYNFAGTSARKEDLITCGQRAIQARWFVFPYIADLYDQLVFYQKEDKHLATDWVMAFCLMSMAYQRETWSVEEEEESVIVVDSIERIPSPLEVYDDSASWQRLLEDRYAA